MRTAHVRNQRGTTSVTQRCTRTRATQRCTTRATQRCNPRNTAPHASGLEAVRRVREGSHGMSGWGPMGLQGGVPGWRPCDAPLPRVPRKGDGDGVWRVPEGGEGLRESNRVAEGGVAALPPASSTHTRATSCNARRMGSHGVSGWGPMRASGWGPTGLQGGVPWGLQGGVPRGFRVASHGVEGLQGGVPRGIRVGNMVPRTKRRRSSARRPRGVPTCRSDTCCTAQWRRWRRVGTRTARRRRSC
jgi:hypothetical protein